MLKLNINYFKAKPVNIPKAIARWVIERSNAWMERCKSLTKNFERTLSHAKTKIDLCFVRLLLKRLATPS